MRFLHPDRTNHIEKSSWKLFKSYLFFNFFLGHHSSTSWYLWILHLLKWQTEISDQHPSYLVSFFYFFYIQMKPFSLFFAYITKLTHQVFRIRDKTWILRLILNLLNMLDIKGFLRMTTLSEFIFENFLLVIFFIE